MTKNSSDALKRTAQSEWLNTARNGEADRFRPMNYSAGKNLSGAFASYCGGGGGVGTIHSEVANSNAPRSVEYRSKFGGEDRDTAQPNASERASDEFISGSIDFQTATGGARAPATERERTG